MSDWHLTLYLSLSHWSNTGRHDTIMTMTMNIYYETKSVSHFTFSDNLADLVRAMANSPWWIQGYKFSFLCSIYSFLCQFMWCLYWCSHSITMKTFTPTWYKTAKIHRIEYTPGSFAKRCPSSSQWKSSKFDTRFPLQHHAFLQRNLVTGSTLNHKLNRCITIYPQNRITLWGAELHFEVKYNSTPKQNSIKWHKISCIKKSFLRKTTSQQHVTCFRKFQDFAACCTEHNMVHNLI